MKIIEFFEKADWKVEIGAETFTYKKWNLKRLSTKGGFYYIVSYTHTNGLLISMEEEVIHKNSNGTLDKMFNNIQRYIDGSLLSGKEDNTLNVIDSLNSEIKETFIRCLSSGALWKHARRSISIGSEGQRTLHTITKIVDFCNIKVSLSTDKISELYRVQDMIQQIVDFTNKRTKLIVNTMQETPKTPKTEKFPFYVEWLKFIDEKGLVDYKVIDFYSKKKDSLPNEYLSCSENTYLFNNNDSLRIKNNTWIEVLQKGDYVTPAIFEKVSAVLKSSAINLKRINDNLKGRSYIINASSFTNIIRYKRY